jgi:UV DNA damage endonuclease
VPGAAGAVVVVAGGDAGPERANPPELGLVCITASDAVRYRTITRKRLLELEPAERAETLRRLYADNLSRLRGAVAYCAANGIRLYRLSSALFPFADSEHGAGVFDEFADTLREIGDAATLAGIRLLLHPEQFVVLNSDRPEVIENSIKILETHALTFDRMGLPRSPWAFMNIHGGKGGQAERLIETIRGLPGNIRPRLTLENDEHAYGADAIAEICRATGVPMVFDAHHHVVREGLDSYDDPDVERAFRLARATWTPPEWQVVHISNGLESFRDPRHHDFISTMPDCYCHAPWIEVEAKQKELAIARLRDEWRPAGRKPAPP